MALQVVLTLLQQRLHYLSSLLPIPSTYKLNGSSFGRPDVDLMFAKWAFNNVPSLWAGERGAKTHHITNKPEIKGDLVTDNGKQREQLLHFSSRGGDRKRELCVRSRCHFGSSKVWPRVVIFAQELFVSVIVELEVARLTQVAWPRVG